MSGTNWPSYEDQIKPCRCGCGADVGVFNKGVGKDYATDACLEKAHGKSMKQYATDEGLPTYRDVIQGKDLNDPRLTQTEYRLSQLKQKQAKCEMLGNEHDAKRIGGMIAQLTGK